MVQERERPYSQFRFRVRWDGLDGRPVEAGFQEVSGLGQETTVAGYRAGSSVLGSLLKAPATSVGSLLKAPETPCVTLKRGIINSGSDLPAWIDEARLGDAHQLRDVTVELAAEDGESQAIQWKLIGAWPIKHTGPSFSEGGTDLAVEELVLAVERIDQI